MLVELFFKIKFHPCLFSYLVLKMLRRASRIIWLQGNTNKVNYSHSVLSLIPSFSLSDVLCDPTDLIWRKEAPFEAMTGLKSP